VPRLPLSVAAVGQKSSARLSQPLKLSARRNRSRAKPHESSFPARDREQLRADVQLEKPCRVDLEAGAAASTVQLGLNPIAVGFCTRCLLKCSAGEVPTPPACALVEHFERPALAVEVVDLRQPLYGARREPQFAAPRSRVASRLLVPTTAPQRRRPATVGVGPQAAGSGLVVPQVLRRAATSLVAAEPGSRARQLQLNVFPPHRCRCRSHNLTLAGHLAPLAMRGEQLFCRTELARGEAAGSTLPAASRRPLDAVGSDPCAASPSDWHHRPLMQDFRLHSSRS